MPRQVATVVENSFVKGFITEATGLQYPPNSVVETDNCIFDVLGAAQRRPGFDLEYGYVTNTVDKTGLAINTYVWKNATGDGLTSFLVVQIGSVLYFYFASDGQQALSPSLAAGTVNLNTYVAPGAPAPGTYECQFADGLAKLFVVHPGLKNFYVTYASGTFTVVDYDLSIRDFESVDDGLAVDTRPTGLNNLHRYRLYNQGWDDAKIAAFLAATQAPNSPQLLGFTTGGTLAAATYYFKITYVDKTGETVASGETSITTTGSTSAIRVSFPAGGGTATGYKVYASTSTNTEVLQTPTAIPLTTNYKMTSLTTGTASPPTTATITPVFPSNADVWWVYKNISDVYDPSTIANNSRGNSPAPGGHFILPVYDQNRSTASGIPSMPSTSSGSARSSVVSFFAGRVFYSGVAAAGYTSKIYFTRILTKDTEVGQCYQTADPTNEELFDLLPDDGGVIAIPDAGTIYKMFPVQNNLVVFAYRGVYLIAGSTGLGFTATDYVVSRLSTVRTVSGTSFIDVNGLPIWWNTDGIWGLQAKQDGGLQVVPLSRNTIQSFYDDIPSPSKQFARGYFNPLTQVVSWIYRSTEGGTVEEQYEYDRVLNFNVLSGAFYPWSVSGGVTVHGISVIDGAGGSITEDIVVDDLGNTIIDDLGNTVTAYSLSNIAVSSRTKFLVSSPGLVSDDFTFAEVTDPSFNDWASTGSATEYESYFITGYKLRGQANKDFQSNYVDVYNEGTGTFYIQGVWDFSVNTSGGRYSVKQLLDFDDLTVSTGRKRPKIRGRGRTLQFKVTSRTGNDFNIIGWSAWETVNATP